MGNAELEVALSSLSSATTSLTQISDVFTSEAKRIEQRWKELLEKESKLKEIEERDR